jgi:hypothetical protein
MNWACILAFVTGLVDQELLAQNEYLVAENRILKAQSQGRLKLTDAERATLGEIGHRGRPISYCIKPRQPKFTLLAVLNSAPRQIFHDLRFCRFNFLTKRGKADI